MCTESKNTVHNSVIFTPQIDTFTNMLLYSYNDITALQYITNYYEFGL